MNLTKKAVWLTLTMFALCGPATAQVTGALKSKAKSGDTAAQLQLGNAYLVAGSKNYNLTEGLFWIGKAAEAGSPEGQARLANAYNTGEIQPPNQQKAREWYTKAALQDYPKAIDYMCYTTGSDTPRDDTQWAHWCQKAEALNLDSGQRAMVTIYSQGLGDVAKDGAKAQNLLYVISERTLKRDDVLAAATAYFDGRLAPPDYSKSLPFYQVALRLGSNEALIQLAEHYEKGLGVETDVKEPARLYAYAAAKDIAEAKDWMIRHPEITPQSIEANVVDMKDIPAGIILFNAYGEPRDFRGLLWAIALRFYPPRALDAEISGVAIVECHLTRTGYFQNCLIKSEDPVGYQFGSATLNVMFRSGKSTNFEEWADVYGGKTIRLSVTWLLK